MLTLEPGEASGLKKAIEGTEHRGSCPLCLKPFLVTEIEFRGLAERPGISIGAAAVVCGSGHQFGLRDYDSPPVCPVSSAPARMIACIENDLRALKEMLR